MTEGTNKNICRTLDSDGSDIVYDFYCEVCMEGGQHLEAEGFCMDCGDYLCSTCVKYHKRTRFTISHDVLDKQNMPKDNPLPYVKYSRVIETKCKIHQGKSVEYYCKEHDFLGCGTCFIMDHSTCNSKYFIPEVQEGFEQSQEYQYFMDNLKQLSVRSFDLMQQSLDNITRAEHCCEQTVSRIKQLRAEINERLDKLEKKLIKKAISIKTENIESMEFSSNRAEKISEELKQMTSRIKSLENDRKICQLYIVMTECSREIRRMSSTLEETENNNYIQLYDFESNWKVTEILKDVNGFGTIQVRQRDLLSQGDAISDSKATKVLPMSDIDLTSDKHSLSYNLTGSAVLSGNRMIVTDYNNKTISLLDTNNRKLMHSKIVTNGPWDVCVISEKQATITVPSSKLILVLTVTDVLSLEREITVNGVCRGIAYSQNRLVVTFGNPPKLEIIDLQGNVIERIENGRDGCKLFRWPGYVCINNEEDTIYVSDHKANKVQRLTFNGVILSEYTDNELKGPHKVCTDERGNIYIASFENRSVHMVQSDCSKIKILLTLTDGLTKYVRLVSHCHQTNRLFVGMFNHSRIKVFQLL